MVGLSFTKLQRGSIPPQPPADVLPLMGCESCRQRGVRGFSGIYHGEVNNWKKVRV